MGDLVQIDVPQEIQDTVHSCVRWSQENEITSVDSLQSTIDHSRSIKEAMKAVDDFFDAPIKQAYDLHRMLCARKKIFRGPLEQADDIDKRKVLEWRRAEAERAEALRRKLQAEADEKARREREALEKKAAAAKKPETKERLMEQAESIAAPVISVASSEAKPAGVAFRKTWKAEITDLEALLIFCCENKRTDLLLVNQKTLDALAKALKERASLPGVRFRETETMVHSPN